MVALAVVVYIQMLTMLRRTSAVAVAVAVVQIAVTVVQA
jgi:hypothetical protein